MEIRFLRNCNKCVASHKLLCNPSLTAADILMKAEMSTKKFAANVKSQS